MSSTIDGVRLQCDACHRSRVPAPLSAPYTPRGWYRLALLDDRGNTVQGIDLCGPCGDDVELEEVTA